MFEGETTGDVVGETMSHKTLGYRFSATFHTILVDKKASSIAC